MTSVRSPTSCPNEWIRCFPQQPTASTSTSPRRPSLRRTGNSAPVVLQQVIEAEEPVKEAPKFRRSSFEEDDMTVRDEALAFPSTSGFAEEEDAFSPSFRSRRNSGSSEASFSSNASTSPSSVAPTPSPFSEHVSVQCFRFEREPRIRTQVRRRAYGAAQPGHGLGRRH